jgi:uncharacterized membrane protein
MYDPKIFMKPLVRKYLIVLLYNLIVAAINLLGWFGIKVNSMRALIGDLQYSGAVITIPVTRVCTMECTGTVEIDLGK